MLGFILVCLASAILIDGLNVPCCTQVPGSCKTSCEQLSLVAIAINANDRKKYMQLLDVYCPKQLYSFWNCINSTLKDVDLNSDWSGRQCCQMPRSNNCQLSCLMSRNRSQLLNGCRQSDEMSFFDCLETHEIGDKCCAGAKTSDCEMYCKEVFNSPNPTLNIQSKIQVETACSSLSPSVVNCVSNYTKATPTTSSYKNINCCDRSDNEFCRSTCKRVLRSSSTSQEAVIDSLIDGGCGHPSLHDSLWQCFLSNSETNRPGGILPSNSRKFISSLSFSMLGKKLSHFDGAKLHCCLQASSKSCQKICFKTFSNDWESSWKNFQRLCMYQPSESKMLRCLEEVDEPCELGCNGLSFCNHFNNRPTQMFRSCNNWTDHRAIRELEMWKSGFINTSIISIPVLDTGQCHPSMLKTIACTLAVKPCNNQNSFAGLCRVDCIEMLTKCVDYNRLPMGISPSAICDMFLPAGHDMACTPLSTIIANGRVSSANYGAKNEVSFPCRPNPCNSSQICMLNRDCQNNNDNCPLHKCVPGCRMGDTSHLLIPPNSLAYIPSSVHDVGCYKICRCSSKAQFEECTTLQCHPTDGCLIGEKRIPHRSTFQFNCNTCLCFAGEVTCTNQECSNTISGSVTDNSGIPCNCPSHYVPVCGTNGRTYPSTCIAMCFGLDEDKIRFGACSNIDHCQPNPCKRNQICLPDRKICLTTDDPTNCLQYQCLEKARDCVDRANKPVCDTQQKQFSSICSLINDGRALAYKGNCIKNCKNVGQVCGQDGETYSSECVALSARTLIDYNGPCSTFAKLINRSYRNCESVECPKPVRTNCELVTPPGACCPICGAAMRLLLNQRQTRLIDRYVKSEEYLTVGSVIDIFRQQIKVWECEVYGYLSVDGELILVFTSTLAKPTVLQVQACVKEAEKLETRINTESPLIISNFKLSSMTLAIAVDACSAARITFTSSNFIYLLLITVLTKFINDRF